MVVHTVLMKIKEGTPQEKVDALIQALKDLKGKVPTLVEMNAGYNFSDRSQGFSVMLNSIFDDKEGLAVYASHPDHVDVLENHIKPILAELVVGDIEY
ncbi:Dabb family protein [Sediminitomix flava]|uniref:Stress responsive alpha/beta barrel protein n=1 Tax=Sediminitomix flava TaxID=379075 RepID=A0A315ZI23_SEDFL|nr:Dabb family protein [Sediminitomix flava]PWJ44468.1 stress responsive alpha/beta barrel protein [Sediminitomix flava]